MNSLLVRILGFRATIIHGDTLVLDRWLWLRNHLPSGNNGTKRLLDVGCGSGAFTIGAARRGYKALGLSWDERNQSVAACRANLCSASLAEFEIQDVRLLDQRQDLSNTFDIVVCCENIEHILDDRKLFNSMSKTLKPSGLLLLTTPNVNYKAITENDNGPFSDVEDGGHVRRGYSREDLECLCRDSDLRVVRIGYCSGFLSQKITALLRTASRFHPLFGWTLIFPLRILPILFDPLISRLIDWPGFCITLIATKE